MIKLGARELRTTIPDPDVVKTIVRHDLSIIVDNVLDTYNVGSIFRLADAVAAKKVILCGETLTPPNSRIQKASINTTGWVSWEHVGSASEAIMRLKRQAPSTHVVAVEQDPRSKLFYTVKYEFPLAIVVGNETTGISPDVLDRADVIVELPMWGVNKSLNVMVSCGIVLYEVMKQREIKEQRSDIRFLLPWREEPNVRRGGNDHDTLFGRRRLFPPSMPRAAIGIIAVVAILIEVCSIAWWDTFPHSVPPCSHSERGVLIG